jgi:hypothetical protein
MTAPPLVRRALLVAALIAVPAFAVIHAAGSPARDSGKAAPLRMKAIPDSLVGRVAGTRAYIAASYDGERLRVYVCDGTRRRKATISQWFKGHWDGRTPLTLVRNGIELKLDPIGADGRITGEMTAFSGPHGFAVEPVTGPAGLYDGTDVRGRDEVRSTWIVLADGSVRGAMACPRPPRRRCRVVVVTMTNGETREEVRCFEVSGC